MDWFPCYFRVLMLWTGSCVVILSPCCRPVLTLRSCPHTMVLFLPTGYVECEPPNNRLHKFIGKLQWKKEGDSESKDYSLDVDNILLRVGEQKIKLHFPLWTAFIKWRGGLSFSSVIQRNVLRVPAWFDKELCWILTGYSSLLQALCQTSDQVGTPRTFLCAFIKCFLMSILCSEEVVVCILLPM